MNDVRFFQRTKDYVWGLNGYFRTEKGRHDLLDYLRALLIIAMLIAVTLILLKRVI